MQVGPRSKKAHRARPWRCFSEHFSEQDLILDPLMVSLGP